MAAPVPPWGNARTCWAARINSTAALRAAVALFWAASAACRAAANRCWAAATSELATTLVAAHFVAHLAVCLATGFGAGLVAAVTVGSGAAGLAAGFCTVGAGGFGAAGFVFVESAAIAAFRISPRTRADDKRDRTVAILLERWDRDYTPASTGAFPSNRWDRPVWHQPNPPCTGLQAPGHRSPGCGLLVSFSKAGTRSAGPAGHGTAIGEDLLGLGLTLRIAIGKHLVEFGRGIGSRRFDGMHEAVHVAVLRFGQRPEQGRGELGHDRPCSATVGGKPLASRVAGG